jgi:hypothetical protein
MKGTRKFLIYDNYVKLLEENTQAIKKNRETLLKYTGIKTSSGFVWVWKFVFLREGYRLKLCESNVLVGYLRLQNFEQFGNCDIYTHIFLPKNY